MKGKPRLPESVNKTREGKGLLSLLSSFDLLPSISSYFFPPFHVLSQKKGRISFFFFFPPLKRKEFGKRIFILWKEKRETIQRFNFESIRWHGLTVTLVRKLFLPSASAASINVFLYLYHRDDLRNGKQGRRINATKTILDVFRRTYRGFPPRSSQGGGPQALNAR